MFQVNSHRISYIATCLFTFVWLLTLLCLFSRFGGGTDFLTKEDKAGASQNIWLICNSRGCSLSGGWWWV